MATGPWARIKSLGPREGRSWGLVSVAASHLAVGDLDPHHHEQVDVMEGVVGQVDDEGPAGRADGHDLRVSDADSLAVGHVQRERPEGTRLMNGPQSFDGHE